MHALLQRPLAESDSAKCLTLICSRKAAVILQQNSCWEIKGQHRQADQSSADKSLSMCYLPCDLKDLEDGLHVIAAAGKHGSMGARQALVQGKHCELWHRNVKRGSHGIDDSAATHHYLAEPLS